MRPIRILHLEDSTIDADLIYERLRSQGLDVVIERVETKAQFVGALHRGGFDLIFADHSLPDYDGLSALDAARTTAPEVPFLFISGTLGEEIAVDTLQKGATDYIVKQRLERLPPAVLRAIKESRLRRERQIAEAALSETQELFQLIVESASDHAIFTLDAQRCITSWNIGAERLLGYPESEALGKDAAMLFTMEDQAAGVPQRELTTAIEKGRAGDDRWHVRKDGSRLWASGSMMPLRRAGGRIPGFLKILRDRTEEKRNQEELAERDRRKDDFLAMLAHELRNPLAPIRNALFLLKRGDAAQGSVGELYSMIERQVQHLVRLVDDLLDVARLSRGKISIQRKPIELVEIVRTMVSDHRGEFESAQLSVASSFPDEPVWILGGPTRVVQVLDNLLDNAAKFTPPNGKIRFTLEKDAERRQAVVAVTDTGIGIEPKILPQLFEPFAQGDASLERMRGGLGLGLALVKGLVALHGGSVEAFSDGPEKGSCFRIRLPLTVEGAEQAFDSPDWTSMQRPLRILVIEDNADAAESLRQLCVVNGHYVSVAHSGPEGLVAAKSVLPDVVISDIELPGMDGYELARALRSMPETASARLVAVTGYGQDHSRRRAAEAGFDLHLVKPVDPRTLLRELSRNGDD